jgi:hypothetical protein
MPLFTRYDETNEIYLALAWYMPVLEGVKHADSHVDSEVDFQVDSGP